MQAQMKRRILGAAFGVSLVMTSCQTVQTTRGGVVGVDRPQQMSVFTPSAAEVAATASQQYLQVTQVAAQKGTLNRDPTQTARVQRIAQRLIPHTAVFRDDAVRWQWQVNVLTSDEVNAWCMPGGKIAVYTGLIEQLKITDDELAAVMGHEIAHALQRHGVERMSRSIIDQIAQLGALGAAAAGHSSGGAIAGLLGAYGVNVSLPFNRKQESEADYIGLRLMSQAGYDPREAVPFWERMSGCPRQMIDKLCFRSQHAIPEFLSTHPSDVTRINQLESWMPEAMRYYQAANGETPPAPAPYKPAIGPMPQTS